jgi:hypothetical protein
MSGIMCAVMGGGGSVNLSSPKSHGATKFDTSTAQAGFTLQSDGQYTGDINTVSSDVTGEWWSAAPLAGVGSLYQARFTETSGTVSSGTVGTFISLAAGASWFVSRSTAGNKTCVGTLEIRPNGGSVLATATITMSATQSP